MKKQNFVGESLNRLPPGFRFQPTDEELLFQYLRCKILSLPLPASIIPEVHFPKAEPWELPGESMEERYVFAKKGGKYQKRNQNNRSKRATNSGYWEETGSEMHLSPPPTQNFEMMMMKGIKKTLLYHMGKSPNGTPTDWYMNEYSLVYNKNYKGASKMEDWVIWQVFLRQRIEENDDAIMLDYNNNNNNNNNSHYRLPSNNNNISSSSFSSSSSSNSFAHVSSYEAQSDEESSYNFM